MEIQERFERYMPAAAAGASTSAYRMSTLLAIGTTVRGLVVTGGLDGIIAVATGDGSVIQGNYSTGNATGVTMLNGASSNMIGGVTPAARNVLSGNLYGVYIGAGSLTSTLDNQVLGNYIGTTADGWLRWS